ncbi:MAG: hypothetical protein LBH14_02145 [Desulfobulbaceae bacterium]|jgi:hypothetical protein|nr:hypothetical protein [Desulfobulbaceae bacterium]
MSRTFLYFGLIVSLVFAAGAIAFGVARGTGHDVGLFSGSIALLSGAGSVFYAINLWPRMFQRETPSLELLLSHYPGPVVLKSVTAKFLVYAVGAVAIGGVLVSILRDDPPPSILEQVLLGLGILLCLVGTILLLVASVKGSSLRLSRDSLEVVALRRPTKVRWHDTSEFTPSTLSASAHLEGTVFNNAARKKSRFSDYNSTIFDTYSFTTHKELAALLNAWRARALQDNACSQNDDD